MTSLPSLDYFVNMPSIDIVFVGLAIIGVLFSWLLTARHWVNNIKSGNRGFVDCIDDIRAMNGYNSYMLAGSLIFLGFVVEKGSSVIPNSALLLIMCSFLCASAAIFFIPLQKPPNNAAPLAARRLWLYTLFNTQASVIFAVTGIINAVISRVFT